MHLLDYSSHVSLLKRTLAVFGCHTSQVRRVIKARQLHGIAQRPSGRSEMNNIIGCRNA
jgi:hypothetical protein